MCHRMAPLMRGELEEALVGLKKNGRATLPERSASQDVADAYPGAQVPLFVPNEAGELEVCTLAWGFEGFGGSKKPIFNTRIETAMEHIREGRGMWEQPMLFGRCLVPVLCFWEPWTKEPEKRGTEVRFTLPGHRVFLLAGVQEGGRFSVVTTHPNPDMVPIHRRMPLVLGPGESKVWLGPDFERLSDRSGLKLDVTPEE